MPLLKPIKLQFFEYQISMNLENNFSEILFDCQIGNRMKKKMTNSKRY